MLILGTIAFILYAIRAIGANEGIASLLQDDFVIVSLCLMFLLIIVYLYRPSLLIGLELGILLFYAVLTLFANYSSYIGLGLFILVYLCLYKFGYLMGRRHLKSVIYFLGVLILEELSLFHGGQPLGLGFNTALLIIFFLVFLYMIYKSEIDALLEKTEQFTGKLFLLEQEKQELEIQMLLERKRLGELEEQISLRKRKKNSLQANMHKYGLTKTERKVVELLISKKATNKIIAQEMGVQANTIKIHLYNVYNKTGVKSRTELMGLLLEE